MTGRAVVITGMGAITPSGLSVDALWGAVSTGRSAVRLLTGDDVDGLPVRIGATVRGFDDGPGHGLVDAKMARRLLPMQTWAVAAGDEAVRQAGLDVTAARESTPELPWDPTRFGVTAATGSGPIGGVIDAIRAFDARGPRAVPSALAVFGGPDAAAAVLSIRYGARGASQALSATCASGAAGIGEALRTIRHGYADAVLVVGMDDCINPANLSANANMRALAYGYEDDPAAACRPFDRAHRGFVMAQGAAAMLLEADEVAAARGARPLARIAGYGASSDAHHPTAPHPDGRGGTQAVLQALADADLGPADIDHLNAHATGTPAGDGAELRALECALGRRARGIPITAVKSTTGHMLGASGVVEAVVSVQTLRHGILPPTLNLTDPEVDGWDYVTTPRPQRVATVLSTSFGFGGHNAALILQATDTPAAPSMPKE